MIGPRAWYFRRRLSTIRGSLISRAERCEEKFVKLFLRRSLARLSRDCGLISLALGGGILLRKVTDCKQPLDYPAISRRPSHRRPFSGADQDRTEMKTENHPMNGVPEQIFALGVSDPRSSALTRG